MIFNNLNTKKHSLKHLPLLCLFLFFPLYLLSQIENGFHIYKYPSGSKSSTGKIINGKPEGYWFTFYENGKKKSEGNRINNQLDSIWKFYREDGSISSILSYKIGKKNGITINYNKDSIIVKESFYKKDTIYLIHEFYDNGLLKLNIPFQNGLKDGFSFEYDTLGIRRTWLNYKQGRVVKKILINRFDNQGRRSGKWVLFNNETLVLETNYLEGLKDGYESVFDKKGALKKIIKFKKGKLLKDVKELKIIESNEDIFSSEKLDKSTGLNIERRLNGIHKEFKVNGQVNTSKVFNNGVLSSIGIIKNTGKKEGKWIFFYASGEKLSEGLYRNNLRIGKWNFFYKNGRIESVGNYDTFSRQNGIWKEFYENGSLREESTFLSGLYDGPFIGYGDSGKVVVKGNYKNDVEIGEWFYRNGSHSRSGSYIDGKKNGEWKHYFNSNQIVFKGSFEFGLPIGEHLFWHKNGNLKCIGRYVFGLREGEWIQYTSKGVLFMVIDFKNGLEFKINGSKINPSHAFEDYIEFEETGYRWLH